MIRRSCYLGEIKFIGCKTCKNKAGCSLKYEAKYVHNGVPEDCLVNGNYQKEDAEEK